MLSKQKLFICIFLSLTLFLLFLFPKNLYAAPQISGVTDNKNVYPNSQIPKYEKYEITFSINNSVATNFFFPYETSVPPGLTPGAGITANAEFLPPGQTDWSTAFITPAFYYQDFDYQVKGNSDWIHPNGNFFWKVRFSPNVPGNWQYRLTAQDSSGSVVSSPQTFSVINSQSRGFIKVSPTDSRYFAFEDGTFFPGLGVNLNFSDIAWVNPVLGNTALFSTLKQKGIQLVRMWQSQWAIYGSFWNPWHYNGNLYDYTWIRQNEKAPGSDFSLSVNRGLQEDPNPCVSFGGWSTYQPAVKPNTNYRIRARVKTQQMGTAVNQGSPYGLVFKTGGWLDNCGNAGVGTISGGYLSTNSDWTIITGSYTTSSTQNFFPWLYLSLDNITTGKAFIDYVWVEEILPNNQFGPNLISKPSMDHLKYIDQRNAYAFDKMLDLAKQHDVYLKVVGLEKNDVEANMTNFDGTTTSNEQNNANFYGNYGAPTKVYWLQKAWWRYQQARWGYSPNIHSWELINEGDPGNGNHWKQTDEMGKFFKCRAFGANISVDDSVKCTNNHPNSHMVSTSFWSTWQPGFWGNSKWPNVDYADIHAYISTSWADTTTKNLMKYDEALYTKWHADQVRQSNVRMPIIRGEAGFDETTTQSDTLLGIQRDTGRVWLHNYLWSQLYSGGLYEQYWWWKEHMTSQGTLDPENNFRNYYNFISSLPLSNGNYVDAAATTGNPQIRAFGQKDTSNSRAHLWIQNSKHTWKNVVDNVNINPISTTVTIGGFSPNITLPVEWWNTYTGSKTQNTLTTNAAGLLTLSINNLSTDLAVKIGDYTTLIGDINRDSVVNILDYTLLSNAFGTNNTAADLNQDGTVNILDYTILSNNFGRTI